ncbi:MAG: hypothetical protein EXR98_10855 [Gemmataceae bacterium]|nr:hypothetical protein [Gemmataceae bacterium]
MEIYVFVRHMLAWSITVAVLWPVMIPWAKVSYAIWNGNKELDEEFEEELWKRSAYASTLMAVVAVACLGLDYLTVDFTDMPAGPIHIVYYFAFLALAAGVMVYCFGMEDFFSGLNLAVIYLYIPTALLFLLWLVIRWNWVFEFVLNLLKEPKA